MEPDETKGDDDHATQRDQSGEACIVDQERWVEIRWVV